MRLIFVVVFSDENIIHSNKNIIQRKFNRQKFLQTKISQSTVSNSGGSMQTCPVWLMVACQCGYHIVCVKLHETLLLHSICTDFAENRGAINLVLMYQLRQHKNACV